MYVWRVKGIKKSKYPGKKSAGLVLKEAAVAVAEGPMIRTQIYLNPGEYEFVQREASRRDEPMAAVIRALIDERMKIPEEAWINNPMLEPTPRDADRSGHADGGINLDHYLYGAPKDYIQVKGKCVEAPPLPDDYYSNRASRDAYDKVVREMDEAK